MLAWAAFLGFDLIFYLVRHTDPSTQGALSPAYAPNQRSTGSFAPILKSDPAGGALLFVSDEAGFLNQPGSSKQPHDFVVCGCSFGNHGGVEHSFAAELAREIGASVYNLSIDGKGSCASLWMYHGLKPFSEKYAVAPPKAMVWLVYEGSLFGGYFKDSLNIPGREAPADIPLLERRDRLLAELRQKSGTSRAANWLFINAVSPLAAKLNTAAAGGDASGTILQEALATQEFGPLLIPENDISVARMTRGERDLPLIAEVIAREARYLEAKGTRLLVVLVPDKRSTYARLWRGDMRIEALTPPGEDLAQLATLLESRRIECVNLLPLFRERSQPGMPFLYYWNDHHWNVATIQLAARAAAEKIKQQRNGVR